MLAAMLPKSRAAACAHCQYAYTGCGGPQCFYYYSKYVSGVGYRCYANTQNFCHAGYVSYRSGCC